MRCDEARDRLLDSEVDAHLASCPPCRADADRLRRMWSMLSALPNEEADSNALRRRFLATVGARRSWPPGRWLLQAAALLVAFGGGVAAAAWPLGGPEQNAPIAELRRELGDVRALLTLSLMQQAAAAGRLQGVRNAAALVDTRPEVASALLDALRRDSDVNVRLAAIRALTRVGTEPVVHDGVVAALEREESPLVSIALMDFVVAAPVPPAVTTLRRVASDQNRDEAVRHAAVTALNRLTEARR